MANKTYNESLTADQVREWLRYDAETGKLLWIVTRNWRAKAGDEAGSIAESNGKMYRYLYIAKNSLYAHRLAWLLTTGSWPDGDIDHIDGNGLNNRLSNLRVVSVMENGRNQRLHKNNKSGVCGVFWRSARGRWEVYITVRGRRLYVGLFSRFQDAVAARRVAEKRHGFHPNHGSAAA